MICRAVTASVILLTSLLTSLDYCESKLLASDDLIKVEVATLVVNDQERNVILVLKPESRIPANGAPDEIRVLPLVIGFEEARSIGVAFHKIAVPRPLSHDLMKKIVEEYGGSVVSCVITKMERETFFAELRLTRGGKEFTIDSRPSDAIGLALRASAPVFVRRSVLTRYGVDPNKPEQTQKTLKT